MRARKSLRILRVGVLITAAVTLAAGLSGCSTLPRSISVDAREVSSVELFIYEYGASNPTVKHTLLDSRDMVAQLVNAYTDVPGSTIDAVPDSAAGQEAVDVRFNLDDGGVVDLTAISLAPEDTIIVWGDGAIQHTHWGVPYGNYYDLLGVTTTVDASQLPSRMN